MASGLFVFSEIKAATVDERRGQNTIERRIQGLMIKSRFVGGLLCFLGSHETVERGVRGWGTLTPGA
jgi:hypothetical protein